MLKQKFAVQFGTSLFIKVISLISGIVVARVAGPSVFGTLSYGLAFVSIWGFINIIFGTAHMKLVSEGQNLGNCMTTYTYLKGISVIIYVIVVLGIIAFQLFNNKMNFNNNEQLYVILIFLAIVVVTEFYRVITNSYTAMLMQAKANIPTVIKTLVYQVGRIIVVLLGAKAIGLSLWNLLAFLIIIPLLVKFYKELPHGKWDIELAKKYYKYGVPTFFLTIIASIIKYADKLVLVHYTSVLELGFYTAAMSIGGSFLLLSSSIGTIFFPLFSKLTSENNWRKLNHKNSIYQTFNALFVMPFIAIIVIIAEPLIIAVLGEEYISSIVPFQIIVASTYFVIIGMPYGNIILGMGRFYLNVIINATHLLVFVVSIIYLVSPKYLDLGATGLAINLMVTYLFKNITFFIISNRIGNIKNDWVNILRSFIVIGVSMLSLFLTSYYDYIYLWWMYFIPLYILVLYSMLYIIGLLNREHIFMMLEIFNLNRVALYIKSEFNDRSDR